MSNILSLDGLSIGCRAFVKSLPCDSEICRRLRDIGLIEGTPVECVLKSPGGDPSAYSVRGAVIALRSEDAHGILVSV